MNIPFIRFFKRDKAEEGSLAVASRPVTAIEKPASERLGKTVLPNSSRIVGLEPAETFPLPAPASSPAQTIPAVSRKISLGGNGSVAVASKASVNLPAAERTIALPLADLVPNLPADLLKPTPVDPERRVILKASEVERGMSTGRPTVLLRVIYKQAPEFFTGEVPATDLREVALPFAKVVEQFASFQVRDDQVASAACPQLETPFLQVTLEDNARFGKPGTPTPVREVPAVQAPKAVAAVQSAVVAAPPAPAAPAPAPAAAAAPKPIAPIRMTAPIPDSAPAPVGKVPPPLEKAPATAPALVAAAPKATATITAPVPAPASTSAPAPSAPAALPLDQSSPIPSATAPISPNGTGGPAAERVPASSGSPVPTPLPSPFAAVPPTRIPFKVSPPSNDLRQPSKFPVPRASQDAVDFSNAGPRVSLPLRNILRNLAPFQLTGPIDGVPEAAAIELPFSIIQPQLSLGRVAISPAQFQAALPEEHRALFVIDPASTPVPLALQDVLQNLPNESLQLRGDQEEPEVAEAFETPFSQKASEDAARMKVSAGPIIKSTAGATAAVPAPVAAVPEPRPKPGLAVVPAPAAKPAVAATPAAPAPAVPSAPPAPKLVPAPAAPVAQAPAPASKVRPAAPTKEISAPVLPAAPAPKVEVAAKPVAATPPATTPGIRTSLQNILDTDEPLDAKSVVGHVSRLPGVRACAIVFSDGLSLAGNIPAEFEADAVCAMAPSIVKRISEQMVGAKFGALSSVTLYCGKTPVSLFAHNNICLATIHSGGEIAAEIRDRLGRTTQELARMYAEAA